jgi:hypothetical protein
MKFVLQYIDVCWLLMAFIVAKKDQRVWVIAYMVGSMVMMRMLSELMDHIGFPNGITGWVDTPVHTRALLIYSLSYIAFIAFFYYNPNARGTLLMAAAIAFFFATFFTTAVIMIP